jgi:hypothetical protein
VVHWVQSCLYTLDFGTSLYFEFHDGESLTGGFGRLLSWGALEFTGIYLLLFFRTEVEEALAASDHYSHRVELCEDVLILFSTELYFPG